LSSSGVPIGNASVRSSTIPVVPSSLSRALLSASMDEPALFHAFKAEIDSVLPLKVRDLTVVATSYHTTGSPYPGISDPFIDQQGYKIGVISRSYLGADMTEPIIVTLEPLLPEYQAPQPTKCGSWDSAPNKTIFDFRGFPAMYAQTPATGQAKASSQFFVCRSSVSIAVETPSYRTKDDLTLFFDNLPLSQIERVVSSGQ
jgi:hypothetical protein